MTKMITYTQPQSLAALLSQPLLQAFIEDCLNPSSIHKSIVMVKMGEVLHIPLLFRNDEEKEDWLEDDDDDLELDADEEDDDFFDDEEEGDA